MSYNVVCTHSFHIEIIFSFPSTHFFNFTIVFFFFFFKCKECVSTAHLQKVLVPLEASRLAQGVDTCPQAVPPGASVSQRLCGRPFPLPWRQTCHGPSWHVRCLPIQQGSASSNHTQGSCIQSSPQRLSQRRPRPAPFSLPRGLEGWGRVGESPALLAVSFLTLSAALGFSGAGPGGGGFGGKAAVFILASQRRPL